MLIFRGEITQILWANLNFILEPVIAKSCFHVISSSLVFCTEGIFLGDILH